MKSEDTAVNNQNVKPKRRRPTPEILELSTDCKPDEQGAIKFTARVRDNRSHVEYRNVIEYLRGSEMTYSLYENADRNDGHPYIDIDDAGHDVFCYELWFWIWRLFLQMAD